METPTSLKALIQSDMTLHLLGGEKSKFLFSPGPHFPVGFVGLCCPERLITVIHNLKVISVITY